MAILETRYFQIWVNFGGMAVPHHQTNNVLVFCITTLYLILLWKTRKRLPKRNTIWWRNFNNTCGCFVFYLSHWLVQVCEIEFTCKQDLDFHWWGPPRRYLFPCSPVINWLVPLFPKNRKCVFLCSLFSNIVFVPLFPSKFGLDSPVPLKYMPCFPCTPKPLGGPHWFYPRISHTSTGPWER